MRACPGRPTLDEGVHHQVGEDPNRPWLHAPTHLFAQVAPPCPRTLALEALVGHADSNSLGTDAYSFWSIVIFGTPSTNA